MTFNCNQSIFLCIFVIASFAIQSIMKYAENVYLLEINQLSCSEKYISKFTFREFRDFIIDTNVYLHVYLIQLQMKWASIVTALVIHTIILLEITISVESIKLISSTIKMSTTENPISLENSWHRRSNSTDDSSQFKT